MKINKKNRVSIKASLLHLPIQYSFMDTNEYLFTNMEEKTNDYYNTKCFLPRPSYKRIN